LAAEDPRVRVIRFSKNFGYEASILTGYRVARGVAAVQMDCDLQDPPELVHEFIRLWKAGNHVVYGIRADRRQEGAAFTWLRKVFYRAVRTVSQDPIPADAGEFRLVDRIVLDELRRVTDRRPYVRGIIASMGFQQTGVEYQRRKRERGKTKFSFFDLFGLAVDGLVGHSTVPLRLAAYFGLLTSVATAVLGMVFFCLRLFGGVNWPAGFAALSVLLLASLSITSLFLGIQGEYIGRILEQLKTREGTIVEKRLNCDDSLPEGTEPDLSMQRRKAG